MKITWLFFLLCCLPRAGWAQGNVLHPDDANSHVGFVINNFGISIDGSFNGLAGDIQFDGNHPTQAKFDVTVKTATINTGNKKRDNHLRSDDFFDAVKFPLIRIKGELPKPTADGKSYILQATIDMHGITGQTSIPFTVKKEGDAWLFEGTFTVNRLNYKVGGTSMTMADEAKVSLKIYARP